MPLKLERQNRKEEKRKTYLQSHKYAEFRVSRMIVKVWTAYGNDTMCKRVSYVSYCSALSELSAVYYTRISKWVISDTANVG